MRKQTWWVLLGLLIGDSLQLLLGWLTVRFENSPHVFLLLQTAHTLTILFIMTTIAISMLFYDLFDVGMVVRRALVYGGLMLGVTLVYFGVIAGAGVLTLDSNNLLVSLVATGVVAFAFQPLRERLQRGVNRLLYGYRDEPYRVLAELSEKIGGTLEPAKVLPAITATVADALRLPYAGVVLARGGALELVASHGQSKGEPVALPLTHQGEMIGELRLEPRTGDPFKAPELRLLRTVAQQASVAAFAVKQNLDLQRSREALVSAREEERLRIRRDLHDGLGPELATLALRLDAARNLLRADVGRADELLLELKAQSQEALVSIRRLVYALRPPALDELGLTGALLEEARKYDSVLVLALEVEALDGLPTAVEVACYRIVQEALANVARHAQATHCWLRVVIEASVRIVVEDDGLGLPLGSRAGVGLTSMRDRAEELGGTFKLDARNGGGVRLEAKIPI